TVSCPGAAATEFSSVAGNDRSRLFKNGGADSAAVAEHAYAAMMKGKRMAVPGVMNKLLVQSLRVSPRGTVHKIAARLNRPMAEGGVTWNRFAPATMASTTDGSARVDTSPRDSGSPSATLRRMRRMTLPLRVLGRPGTN